MIDLGKYADTVLSAYGVSFVLVIALVLLTMHKNGQSKRRLAELEAKRNA